MVAYRKGVLIIQIVCISIIAEDFIPTVESALECNRDIVYMKQKAKHAHTGCFREVK